MTVAGVEGVDDVYTIDTRLWNLPGVMSAYLLEAERPALIDAGAAPAEEPVLQALATRGLTPADLDVIIITHVHLDHAGAAGGLAKACPNAEVVVHERGRPYIVDPERLNSLVDSAQRAMDEYAAAYGDPDPVPPGRCRSIADGDIIDLGDRQLRTVYAPGHAPHQVCLYDPGTGVVFAADAAGMAVGDTLQPSTPPPDFDLEASLRTLDRLAGLEPAVVCYGHFGARSDAETALARYRKLLPRWVAAVARSRERHGDDRHAIVADLGESWASPTLPRDVAGALAWLDAD